LTESSQCHWRRWRPTQRKTEEIAKMKEPQRRHEKRERDEVGSNRAKEFEMKRRAPGVLGQCFLAERLHCATPKLEFP